MQLLMRPAINHDNPAAYSHSLREAGFRAINIQKIAAHAAENSRGKTVGDGPVAVGLTQGITSKRDATKRRKDANSISVLGMKFFKATFLELRGSLAVSTRLDCTISRREHFGQLRILFPLLLPQNTHCTLIVTLTIHTANDGHLPAGSFRLAI